MSDRAVRMESVSYAWPRGPAFALEVDAFELGKGESTLLVGASGSGKSTLLSLIAGAVRPDRGRIEIDGENIASLGEAARDRLRAERIGVIFQTFNLLPYASPLDNILLPLAFAPERRKRAGDARETALSLASALELPKALMIDARAGELSVGQQQRVAVARALIGGPSLIVADEPTSALDPQARDAFLDLLFQVTEAAGAALLLASHDPGVRERFKYVLPLDEIARARRGGTS